MKMYLLLKIGDFPAIFVLGVVFHPSQVGLPSLLRYICQDAKALDVQRSHPGDIRRYQVSQVMPLSPQGYLVVPLVTPKKICFLGSHPKRTLQKIYETDVVDEKKSCFCLKKIWSQSLDTTLSQQSQHGKIRKKIKNFGTSATQNSLLIVSSASSESSLL